MTTKPAAPAAKTKPAAPAVGETGKTADGQTVETKKVAGDTAEVAKTPPAKKLTAEEAAAQAAILTKAENDLEGYTLLPKGKVEKNHTVELVEPVIEIDGKVVVKRKA